MKYIVSKGKNFMVVYYNDEKKIESMLKNIQLKKPFLILITILVLNQLILIQINYLA